MADETANETPEENSGDAKADAPEAPKQVIKDLAELGAASAAAEEEAAAAEASDEAGEEQRTITDLADLAPSEAEEERPLAEPKRDEFGRSYATGKRKDAVARVWLKPGNGQITVNGRTQEIYFARPTLRMLLAQPFEVTSRQGEFDVVATVKGGGLSGQAGAVRHGISKALTYYEPSLRPSLKSGGFLTRDSRVVERKKYGRHKARKKPQFSKR